MLEFIEPEINTRDISLQNTLIAGAARNTHLLLMGLRRENVNLALHSLDFCWVFIKKKKKKNFLVASQLQDVEKKA